MSHPYIVHPTPGDPSSLAHQEILEEVHTRLYHAHDVFPRCRHIMEIVHAGIDRGIFPDFS